MTHREARLMLADFEAGAVDATTESALRHHVESCRECSSWLVAYRWIASSLGENPALGVDAAHPSSDLLGQWVVSRHHLDTSGQRMIVRHLRVCHGCHGAALSLSAALRAARVEPPEGGILPSRGALRRRATLLAAAAAAVVLVLVSWPRPESRHLDPAPATEGLQAGALEIHGQDLEGNQRIEGGRTLVLRDIRVRDGAEITFTATERLALGDGVAIGSGSRVVFEVQAGRVEPALEREAVRR